MGIAGRVGDYAFKAFTATLGIATIYLTATLSVNIQLLDLPRIIEGASEGKGCGRQVIVVAKSSDIVLMVLDASKSFTLLLLLLVDKMVRWSLQ
uniref:GTP-binding protein C02F5.3 n=1 Tax=Cajanus cajan TaxID=3821 RepID=A0A151QZF3_CAJCA|nr:putative GTP-binding protein C02F5.3 [Cajanus cajan]